MTKFEGHEVKSQKSLCQKLWRRLSHETFLRVLECNNRVHVDSNLFKTIDVPFDTSFMRTNKLTMTNHSERSILYTNDNMSFTYLQIPLKTQKLQKEHKLLTNGGTTESLLIHQPYWNSRCRITPLRRCRRPQLPLVTSSVACSMTKYEKHEHAW